MTHASGRASSEAEQAGFFEQVRERFDAAAARAGHVVRDYRIAGLPLRLRFAGEAVVPSIVPALANPLEHASDEPRYEICIWDSASTGVAVASCPRPFEDFTARGNIWGFDSLRYRTAYQWAEYSLSALDRETGLGFFWVPTPGNLPTWTLAAPLRTLLHWIMEMNGRQLVHAAAVGLGQRGALLLGRSGAGKSSTALACLEHGLDFVSDDYLALALDPQPVAFRLYNTAKVDPAALHVYPNVVRWSRVTMAHDCEKAVLFVDPERLCSELPIQQVLKPRVAGVTDTSFGAVQAREIEHALSGEVLAHLPHVGAHTLDFLDRVSDLPASLIHVGTDRSQIAGAIAKAMDGPADRNSRQRLPAAPLISLLVYFNRDDREVLDALAASIEAQGYRRAELLVIVEGGAVQMESAAAALHGMVRFCRCERPANKAAAWNRGIREALGDLILLMEPQDRFGDGALDAYAAAFASELSDEIVQGAVEFQRPEEAPQRPLAGALIRRSAFREHGLFDPQPGPLGWHEQEWLSRTGATRARGLDGVVLRAGPLPAPPKIDLSALKQRLDRERLRP